MHWKTLHPSASGSIVPNSTKIRLIPGLYPGAQQDFILTAGLRILLILFSIQDVITLRRHPECSLNRFLSRY